MNNSLFSELYFKAFRSGNRLYLLIAINIAVFLILGMLSVFGFLFTRNTASADWLRLQLSMPAWLPDLFYKPWTLFTYMFSHSGLLHILFNMLWLYWMGRIFLDFLNKRQLTFTYLGGGLAGAAAYLLAYNLFPAFDDAVKFSVLLGASASIMAIVAATATLVPDFTIVLLFFGAVKLKYLALIAIVLDVLFIAGANPGGSIAHIGGAVFGFLYVKRLQAGTDWSGLLKKRSSLKVVKTQMNTNVRNSVPDQAAIDRILDKISVTGYESLSKSEKEQLFKASDKK